MNAVSTTSEPHIHSKIKADKSGGWGGGSEAKGKYNIIYARSNSWGDFLPLVK